jgi:hypothetical protein
MTRPLLLLAVTLSAMGGWTVSARADDPPAAGKEGVTRPASPGREGVTRPGKTDEHDHDHEHEGPKSSAPT